MIGGNLIFYKIVGHKKLHFQDTIFFETMSGRLIVEIIDDFYFLDFPSRKAMSSSLPLEIEKSLNIQPKEIYKSRDYLLIYENQ